jgi:glutamate-1-semialdehyde aminotransferase
LVEPIQGEGGYIVRGRFLPALRALCDRHGILLIAMSSGRRRANRQVVEHREFRR